MKTYIIIIILLSFTRAISSLIRSIKKEDFALVAGSITWLIMLVVFAKFIGEIL